MAIGTEEVKEEQQRKDNRALTSSSLSSASPLSTQWSAGCTTMVLDCHEVSDSKGCLLLIDGPNILFRCSDLCWDIKGSKEQQQKQQQQQQQQQQQLLLLE